MEDRKSEKVGMIGRNLPNFSEKVALHSHKHGKKEDFSFPRRMKKLENHFWKRGFIHGS